MSQSIISLVIIVLLVVVLASSIKIIHQQKIGLVERLGKFNRRLNPGPHLLIPIIDRVQYNLDMREQVVPFPPQGVITEDNLMVNIDSVIYFQIVDPERAAYEAQSYKTAIEQLTMTTLRNIIGGMDMEAALTSREEINQKLRSVLDEATGKWGIKVNRVELRAIEPPPTIRDAMEKGARAERDKRAAILLRSCEPKAIVRLRYCVPRPIVRPRCCAPRVKPRPSRPCSMPSMLVSPTKVCWPTNTCRCCQPLPVATPTRCGWSPLS